MRIDVVRSVPSLLPPLVFCLILAASVLRAEDAFKPFPMPAWTLKDVEGNPVASAELKGKVVVLDFWATWCGPCRSEIPGYIELQKKYRDAGLVIVGVSLDQDGAETVKKFVSEAGINYRIVMGDGHITEAFGGVDAIPTTFIIDRGGTVQFRKVGAMAREAFEGELAPWLKP
jgi:thiol-disulfide isomerase/thioredoxin